MNAIVVSSREARKAICKRSTLLPSPTEGIAMNIRTRTNDAKSGAAPDSDEESSCLSRRNMILGGAAVVAAISLQKNGLASTPLSTTGRPSTNNKEKDDNMNLTTEVPEPCSNEHPTSFTVIAARK